MTQENQRIADTAANLGRMIAGTTVFAAFKDAHGRLSQDAEARELITRQQAALDRMRSLEAEGRPVEPADKHALREAQEQLHGNALLQDYARAQADFIALMNQVTAGIHTPIHLEPVFGEEEGTEAKGA